MTRDDALLWLNDRLGKSVGAWIAVEHGDAVVVVFEAEGELAHWSSGNPAALGAPTSDELHGRYRIGASAVLDLSDVRPLEVTLRLDDHLAVRLDDHTTFEVVAQDEP